MQLALWSSTYPDVRLLSPGPPAGQAHSSTYIFLGVLLLISYEVVRSRFKQCPRMPIRWYSSCRALLSFCLIYIGDNVLPAFYMQ